MPDGVEEVGTARVTDGEFVDPADAVIFDENGKKIGRINQTKDRNITTNKIRCNHYVTKSYEEYIARMNKGSATAQISTEYRGIEKFNMYDKNEVYDDIMDKYIKELKK